MSSTAPGADRSEHDAVRIQIGQIDILRHENVAVPAIDDEVVSIGFEMLTGSPEKSSF